MGASAGNLDRHLNQRLQVGNAVVIRSSFTSEEIDDALGVIMDSDFVPRNPDLEAFRYDSDLARDLMNFVERQPQD
jgi:hypothetical protein